MMAVFRLTSMKSHYAGGENPARRSELETTVVVLP